MYKDEENLIFICKTLIYIKKRRRIPIGLGKGKQIFPKIKNIKAEIICQIDVKVIRKKIFLERFSLNM